MENRVALYARLPSPNQEAVLRLRRNIEDTGAVVASVNIDDARLCGRGKNAAWRSLIANLEGIDQIALLNASDIPGRTVTDLLNALSVLQSHNVHIKLHHLDTSLVTHETLDLIAAYRRGKLSQAIRAGQAEAIARGKRVGRPRIPTGITNQIKAVLANGGGIRETARRFNTSPASVIAIRSTTVLEATSG